MNKITLNLTVDQLNVILAHLLEGKLRDTLITYSELRNQADAQAKATTNAPTTPVVV